MTKPVRPRSPVVRRLPLRHRLHRTTGIAAGVLLLYLIGTGLPLQLTTPLGLGSRYVDSPMVLDWYGIGAPESGWQSSGVSYVGGLVFHGRRPVAEASGFQGAVVQDDLVVVAAGPKLLLFLSAEPDIVDTLTLAEPVARIGRTAGHVVLDTAEGLLALNPATLALGQADADAVNVEWSHSATLTGAGLAPYRDAARARVLTMERLLQDLHSGRAFGATGEWLVNVASLALAALAISGYWIWWRSR